MKAPSPAFSIYPKDLLSDGNCSAMSDEEFGVYMRLLFHAWLEGSIPSDPQRLARLTRRTKASFGRIWPAIAPCFEQKGPELVQKRLEIEREKQSQRSAEQTRRGLMGGRPPKSNRNTKNEKPGLSLEKPEGFENKTQTKARAGASSPSPFPSPSPGTDIRTQQQQQAAREAARTSSSEKAAVKPDEPREWIDHDPKSSLQAAVVARIEELARKEHGDGATADQKREILQTVSLTPVSGAMLEGSLRHASARWLGATLASAARFERETLGDDLAEDPDPPEPDELTPEAQERIREHLAMRSAQGR